MLVTIQLRSARRSRRECSESWQVCRSRLLYVHFLSHLSRLAGTERMDLKDDLMENVLEPRRTEARLEGTVS